MACEHNCNEWEQKEYDGKPYFTRKCSKCGEKEVSE